ncbi:MAG: ArgK/MeaB family GTPase [Paracoccaceae bacterium]
MSDALDRLAAGGKPALARALAAVEADPSGDETHRLLDAALARPRGHAIGLTGPPGVGKSTLSQSLVAAWRAQGLRVGVIAVDPSSARTRGALLGDRTRLRTDPSDRDVFVRSMAARDRLGGVAEITFPALVLMRALFDRVLVETVGVGQSETAVSEIADTVVVCAQPGSGDTVQYMKAGVMEIPHIVAVTKADLGALAERTAADLAQALALGREGGGAVDVVSVSAAAGTGLDGLLARIEARIALDLDAARHAQAKAWAAAQIIARFGRSGLAALDRAGLAPETAAPFAALADRAARLDAALATLRPALPEREMPRGRSAPDAGDTERTAGAPRAPGVSIATES